MMVLLRVLWLALFARSRALRGPGDVARITLTVWPHEAGFNNLHHHTFLKMMEVGRWDLFLRAGSTGAALRRGWVPVVASLFIRYRRPIRRFTRFELSTRIACWDEKDIFVEQTFEKDGELLARGAGRFRIPGGKVPVTEVMRTLFGGESPPEPAWVADYRRAEEGVAPKQPAGERPAA